MKRLLAQAVTRGVPLAAIALAASFASGSALAATAANTTISNLATLNYKVGTVDQDPIGSSKDGNKTGAGTATTFKVDNKVRPVVDASGVAAVTAIPGQTGAVLGFTVTNDGNDDQDFHLTIGNAASGAVFTDTDDENVDLTKCQLKINGGGAVAAPAYTGTITPGISMPVQVVCDIPKTMLDQKIAGVYLMAEARATGAAKTTPLVETTTADNADSVDIVFADDEALDDTSGANAGKRNARHSARSGFKVVTATVTVKKTVTPLCDPFNGNTLPKNIPGAYVQYVIEVTNAGNGAALLTTIGDTLNANVTIDPDLITGASCVAGSGGNGFQVDVTGTTRGGYPKTYTTSTTADGADWTDSLGTGKGGTIAIDFTKVLPAVSGSYEAGELKKNETVKVTYNVKIN